MNKIIIIKTGQFESFSIDSGNSFSLGDVLRTTCVLRVLGNEKDVTWFTHQNAITLLPRIANLKIFEFNINKLGRLANLENTLTINLEKDPKLISFLEKNKKYIIGFVYSENNWVVTDYSGKSFSLDEWYKHCRLRSANTWGQMLQMLIGPASGIGLPLYQKPIVKITSDIGLNWHIGNKWPSKKIEPHIWKKLLAGLQTKYSVSWQKGLGSTAEYAKWIASNRLIITIDSLGLHLANAMDIPTIALFGSTDFDLHDAGPRSRYIAFDAPKEIYSCMPCWKSNCHQTIHCSNHLNIEKVYKLVDDFCLMSPKNE